MADLFHAHTPAEPDQLAGQAPADYAGLALSYASAALEWVQEPAVYALFRAWLEQNPETTALTRKQLKAAEILVTVMASGMFDASGDPDEEVKAGG